VAEVAHTNTAAAVRDVAAAGDRRRAAIGSALAGQLYGLQTLRASVEDAPHNATRFLVMARDPSVPPNEGVPVISTFVFEVRSVPAALYKALGGFATNGVNLTKLESYMVRGEFVAARFYADVEAHPSERRLELALEELRFFSEEVRILGVYPASAARLRRRA
jgi:prephenate dehydratase